MSSLPNLFWHSHKHSNLIRGFKLSLEKHVLREGFQPQTFFSGNQILFGTEQALRWLGNFRNVSYSKIEHWMSCLRWLHITRSLQKIDFRGLELSFKTFSLPCHKSPSVEKWSPAFAVPVCEQCFCLWRHARLSLLPGRHEASQFQWPILKGPRVALEHPQSCSVKMYFHVCCTPLAQK